MGHLGNGNTRDQAHTSGWLVPGATLVLLSAILLRILAPLWKFRHFSGPLKAKLSPFWLTSQCRKTQRSQAVMKEHEKRGDFVQIGPNHISINNPTALPQIYAHKTGFTKSEFYDAFLQVTPVVFNARNPIVHSSKRKYLNPAFSARALSEFEPYMDVELLAWKRQLLGMLTSSPEVTVDFAVWTNFLAFDVIGSFAFGRAFGFIERAYDPYNLIRTIDIRGEVLNAMGTIPSWLRPFMKYDYLDSFWSSGLRATANLERIGREAYQRRKECPEDRKDLLSYLFAAMDAKSPVKEDEIIAESISFIVGGSDTTSSTMTNFIDFVSRDRELQRRLQEEIDTHYPGVQDGSRVPQDKDVSTFPFLLAVLREVMRIRPTSSTGLERVTPKGGRVIAGKFIPENTIVSVPTCGVLNDPRLFKDPAEFRPERWLEGDSSNLLEHFVPFSIGPRACIGRNFAWMEILKAVVLIFKLFDVERLDKRTVIREGFFNKCSECEVLIRKRQ